MSGSKALKNTAVCLSGATFKPVENCSTSVADAQAASGVTVSAGNAAGPPGGTVTEAVSLNNDVPVRAIQLRLTDTPNDLMLAAGSARTAARSAALMADANEQEDGSVIAVLISIGAALIAAGGGPVRRQA